MPSDDARRADPFPLGAAVRSASLHAGLAAVARQLGRRAEGILRSGDTFESPGVHALRVTTKRLRSLWQLERPSENGELARATSRRLRDAARALAPLRDAWVGRSLLRELEVFAEPGEAREFAAAAGHLATLAAASSGPSAVELRAAEPKAAAPPAPETPSSDSTAFDPDRVRAAFLAALESDRAAWHRATEIDDATILDAGFGRTLFKNAELAAAAMAERDPRRLHRWRRWVKYLRYQLEPLLGPERSAIGELQSEAKRIGGLLGRHHDLYQLRRALAATAHPVVLEAIDRRSRQLESRLPALDETLFRLPVERLVAALRHDLAAADEAL